MLDYAAIRKFYFDKGAEKCAADPTGQGRFESAFFHTIKLAYEIGVKDGTQQVDELAERIKQIGMEATQLQDSVTPLINAAEGLAMSEDWNAGTNAAFHRPRLIAALRKLKG